MMATYTHAPHRPAKTDGRLSPGTILLRGKVESTGKKETESRDQPPAAPCPPTKVTPYSVPITVPLPSRPSYPILARPQRSKGTWLLSVDTNDCWPTCYLLAESLVQVPAQPNLSSGMPISDLTPLPISWPWTPLLQSRPHPARADRQPVRPEKLAPA